MEVHEIHDEREFYEAIRDYTRKAWQWVGFGDDDADTDCTPDELIDLLYERIHWVEAHKRAVDRYLRRRQGPTWVRVIDGSKTGPAS